MVPHEVGPLAGDVELRALSQGRRDGGGVLPGQREVHRLHADEVELEVEPVTVLTAEEVLLLWVGQVDLPEEGRVTGAADDEVPHVPEVALGVEAVGLGPGVRVVREHERHGIDPEAGDTELQPEAEGP